MLMVSDFNSYSNDYIQLIIFFLHQLQLHVNTLLLRIFNAYNIIIDITIRLPLAKQSMKAGTTFLKYYMCI